ncbi:hypothetical protein AAEU38_13130 [Bacteroides thetaiotaomicron]|uniref:hypothetical protein n=1 Tax=Bacteroides thetaiotaomicron TaxID=818 RepID=UPI00313B6F57
MATHKSYKCTNSKCSFSISWSEDGISPIMSGTRVSYQCPKCGNIEFDFFDGYGQPKNEMKLTCERCDYKGLFKLWAPSRDNCPECGAKFEEDPDGCVMMVD